MKKITLQDISESLEISKSTISHVLNGRGDKKRVSKETQEKILKFAREHNYKANQLARSLSRGKSEMIGLVIPNISDTFYARIARRIERKAHLSGYKVVYSSTGESMEKESELIHSMLDQQVDGLIIASSQKNPDDIQWLKSNDIPFVLIDRHYPDIQTNYVIIDNADGVSTAVEHLAGLGRKRIGIITLKPGLEAMHQRLTGYRQAMDKLGFDVEEGFVRELAYEHIDLEMHEAIKDLVQFPNRIDGIVFATHFLAAAGLRELKKLNVKVPGDVAMVSFGQMSAFDLVDPPITSVTIPTDDLGDMAVDILLQNMEAGPQGFNTEDVKTKLLVRKSCGTP